ncbi:Fibronectin type III domain protein [Paragonimus heterotremus]|uniref:Fibronectin type III domain protein n=1 Tax=Paragonimus heterotremus TaxID=100268 RepID=A0A8J4WFA8_9TREM|nr:Fibronectin type III domain protein [Paragonimus heterotremus]
MKLTGISIMLAEIPLSDSNWGACKNACFCFSCLASTKEGQEWMVNTPRFLTGNDYFFTIDGDESFNRTPSERAETADKGCVLSSLTNLLDMTDMETSWFAAMAIRSLISHPQGLITVRRYQPLVNALRDCLLSEKTCPELREEAKIIMYLLGPLPPAPRPKIIAYGQTSALVRWTSLDSPGRLPVTYKLYIQSEGSSEPKLAYSGSNLETRVRDLTPYTKYTITLKSCTDAEESPCSEWVTLLTEEAIPSAPCDLRATTVTTTQVRLVWSPPRKPNGVMRYYLVRVECVERRQSTPVVTTAGLQWKRPLSGLRYNEKTIGTNAIISGLLPNTLYTFSVCLVNGKGAGPCTALTLKTLDSGIHWPSKPMVTVLGRSEVTVSWEPPKLTPGRIMRYEVYLNCKKTPVYSGTAHHCRLIGLRPDTEYSFVVIVVTNTGKFESKPIRRRTPRDEYACSARPSVPEFSWRKQPRQDSQSSLQSTFALENKTSLSTSDKPVTADNKGKSTQFSWLTSLSMPCLINSPEVKMVDSVEDSQGPFPKKVTELKSDRARFQSVPRGSPRTCHNICKRNTPQPLGRAASLQNQTPCSINSDMGDRSGLSDHATSVDHLDSGEKPSANPEPEKQLSKCAFAYLCKGMVTSSRATTKATKQQTSRLPLPLEKPDGWQNISFETTGSHNLSEGMRSLVTGGHLDPSLYYTNKKSTAGFLRLPFRMGKSQPPADTYQIKTVQDVPNTEVNSLNQSMFQRSNSILTLRPPIIRLIPPSNLITQDDNSTQQPNSLVSLGDNQAPVSWAHPTGRSITLQSNTSLSSACLVPPSKH